ncbi:MAG: PAS domain S-box protein [Candidatus Rokubacteria bacterium]|nr:PAS domain S-box protein [Candidatus Rokubacteria bacterium]MBI3077545.1 PAS domain S-box protein [Deltaproteobacteria bacterium]
MADRRESRETTGHGPGETERYEKLYAMLLDAIPSSVLLIDARLHVVSANRNFLEKARRAEADTLGQRIDAVFPPLILDHMDLARRVRDAFERGEPTRGERMTYRSPGLTTRVYYYSLIPFAWRGTVEHVMLLLEDVTEQVRLGEEARRAERHVASVVESASDLVLSTDVDGRILTWNTAAERVSGYSRDEVRGRLFSEQCSEPHRALVTQEFARARSGREFGTAEWDLVTKPGALVPVAWVGSAMKNDLGRVVAIVVVGRDLTERRKLEAQLLQSQKLAALGVLAGGIAHEIRNPLALSSSGAQFLLEDSSDAEFRRECAAQVQEGIRRASVIIENLLRFARPGDRTDVEPMDVVSVVRDAAALVANQARVQQINMVVDLPPDPVRVSGVPSMLQQVFLNLLLNAVNAMPGGGLLRVDVERVGLEGQVRVSDTGHGIPAGEMDKVFDPFYTTQPVGKGTGLGLSICYSLVKHHFGAIEVESVEGQGSTFTVRLPLL